MSVVMEEPFYELIRNERIHISTESWKTGEEYYEVEDPIKETAVVIEITINQYTQSLEFTHDHTNNPYFYYLEGFLGEDEDEATYRLDELDTLVHDKAVNAQTLEKIKRFVWRHSSRIKEVALELRRADLCIEVEFDLIRQYGTHEVVVDDGFRMMFESFNEDDNNEDMFDIDDNNDVRKPALQSSVEALETRKFEKKEDLELMMKSSSGYSRSCMVCLDEFSIDDATDEGIWIKTMPCKHVFHKGCIDKWLEKRYTCPNCRYAMPTAD